jgi:hypothetical protein
MMRVVLGIVAAGTAFFGVERLAADIITEFHDAGDMPLTAQASYTDAPLTAIIGTLPSTSDADMYAIWISDPAVFSATTEGKTQVFDPQLFFFNAKGYGVHANDDIRNDGGGYDPQARLPAGDPGGPQAPGLYYLAISSWNLDPCSTGGKIFNDDTYFNQVVGPVGPGGGDAITGWVGIGGMNGSLGEYTITLTGASTPSAVPEPNALFLFLVGGVAWTLSRRRAS